MTAFQGSRILPAMQLRMSLNRIRWAVLRRWIGRIAAASFLFFLLKGLVWLGIGAFVVAKAL